MALTKVHNRMTEGSMVNVFDYMTATQISDVKANTAIEDVTTAIQNAINSNDTVYFPAGTYKITSTITVDNTSIIGDNSHNQSIIKYDVTDGSAAIDINGYYNNGYYTTVKNMGFKGPYTSAVPVDNKAVFLYNNSAEDIDAYFDNCFFNGFKKSIHIKGRGLTVTDSVFVNTLDAIYLDRVNPVNEGSEGDQKEYSGARVYQIYNCRFHSMGQGSCVSNVEATNLVADQLRGVHFVGNYIDTSARIMNGPCRESVFTGNIHIYADPNQTLFYNNADDYDYVTISGNTFATYDQSGPDRHNKQILYCGGNVDTCVFSNNSVWNVDEDVIEVAGNASRFVVTSNNFTNVILDANTTAAHRVLKIDGDATRIQFNNNTIEVNGVPTYADYVVYIGGTASDVDASNNAHNESALSLSNKGAYLNAQRKINYGAAAPTSGDWVQGDIIYNTGVSAGGTVGWVCTTSGTPGTWKTFGAVSA